MRKIQEVLKKFGILINSPADLLLLCKKSLDVRNYDFFQHLIYPRSPVLSVCSKHGETILHYACNIPDINHNILESLLSHGANINAQMTNDGFTPLHVAFMRESMIFSHKKDVNESFRPKFFNNSKFLIKNGADLGIYNKFNSTPVDFAVNSNYVEAVEIFINEKIPIHVENRCLYVIKRLIKKQYYSLTSNRSLMLLKFSLINTNFETFNYILNKIKRDNDFKAIGFEALCLASVIKDGLKYIKVFVDQGIDPKTPNKNGPCALFCALQEPNTEIVKYLLDCGISVNRKFYSGVTPLYKAIQLQSAEIVELLLKRGAALNGWSCYTLPLIVASDMSNSSPKVINILLHYGAEINGKDHNEETALSKACERGHLEIVKILLSKGAKIERENVTTLHNAVVGRNLDIVKMMLEEGLSVNSWCIKFGTPLAFAITQVHLQDHKYKPVLEFLLAHVAKMRVSKKYISKENQVCLEHNCIQKMFEIYIEEVTKMKERNISPELNFSFLDILTKDIDYLGGALQQEELRLVLNEGKYQNEFPIYSKEIEDRIEEAILRRRLIEIAIHILSSCTKKKITFEIVVRIFENCTNTDLTNFSFVLF